MQHRIVPRDEWLEDREPGAIYDSFMPTPGGDSICDGCVLMADPRGGRTGAIHNPCPRHSCADTMQAVAGVQT